MTYDGHPLYTYIGDNGPGQANGNDLDLNGGLWYEMRVSGWQPREAGSRPGRATARGGAWPRRGS